MGPNIPGISGPYDGSGGGKRKRKKKSFFRRVMEFMGSLILWTVVACVAYLAIEAVPYLLKFEPGDTMAYSNENIFGKIEVFKDAMRHKRGISEMRFSHDGKSITFTDTNGTLTGIDAEGYDYDEGGDFERDLDEARRLLKEWGLD